MKKLKGPFPHLIQVEPDLYIRQLCSADAWPLWLLTDANRVHLARWLPWVENIQEPSHSMHFITTSDKLSKLGQECHWGIFSDDLLIGLIGLHQISQENRKASIGYWLVESETGQGFLTKSLKPFISHLFSHMNFHRIEIRAAVSNWPSRHVPERLGFTSEGTLRESEWLYDHFVDLHVYSMLDSEWTAPATPEAKQ